MSFVPDRSWIRTADQPPLAIAHRGASAYTFDNTLTSFEIAHALGAEMWEVDLRLSADGEPVVFHDETMAAITGREDRLSDLSYAQIAKVTAAAGRRAPLLDEVIALAQQYETALYLDAKQPEVMRAAVKRLLAARFERAILGTAQPEAIAELRAEGCPYPLSLLAGPGVPLIDRAVACGADIVHPCWEHVGERPDQLLTPEFFAEARRHGMPVVTWHEERMPVLRALMAKPVLGICTDQPELMRRYRDRVPNGPQIVCHRGLCTLTPENTLASAQAAYSVGYDIVEIDLQQTSDGHLVVHHDVTMDRTTTGSGAIRELPLEEVRKADAGIKLSSFHKGQKVPLLREIVDCAHRNGGGLYVELKEADPIAVVEEVSKILPTEKVFYWSFCRDYLATIASKFPQSRLMARAEDYGSVEECLADLQPDIVEFNATNADPESIKKVRRAGAQAMIAYKGNDIEVMGRVVDLSPDLLNLNYPYLAQRLLEKRPQVLLDAE
ncbi:glycerophosphodiester phosphodiesterase [Pseudovibrio exalbescens]|uniref:GP-PDE domain-containing protein n=1 Tax=Pseudovibrio exalbescens TaxID=197461 RepID=A0A1U7JGD6_9HYPH|nr:glycerophosphodiester phosphodiesterase family protein [Pseudovibrio exalbescens]OKL43752.1 hypothetical protein A3843_11550 [Pseudovibrio exalbescens]